jgi:hypothetical protein
MLVEVRALQTNNDIRRADIRPGINDVDHDEQ